MSLLGIIQNPFCQIENKRITKDHCCKLQTACPPSRCFGCSSSYRLCGHCCRALVAFPEVDLCELCLADALIVEGECAVPQDNFCSCAERVVHYSEYRLCLKCTVSKFAPDDFDISRAPRAYVINHHGKLRPIDLHSHLFGLAVYIVVQQKGISTTLVKERLLIGDDTARKLLEEMAGKGFIYPPNRKNWWRSKL